MPKIAKTHSKVQDLQKAIEKIREVKAQDCGDCPVFTEIIDANERNLLEQYFKASSTKD